MAAQSPTVPADRARHQTQLWCPLARVAVQWPVASHQKAPDMVAAGAFRRAGWYFPQPSSNSDTPPGLELRHQRRMTGIDSGADVLGSYLWMSVRWAQEAVGGEKKRKKISKMLFQLYISKYIYPNKFTYTCSENKSSDGFMCLATMQPRRILENARRLIFTTSTCT